MRMPVKVEQRPFDAVKWREDPSSRFTMVDDMMENVPHVGRLAGSIEKILGEPDGSRELLYATWDLQARGRRYGAIGVSSGPYKTCLLGDWGE